MTFMSCIIIYIQRVFVERAIMQSYTLYTTMIHIPGQDNGADKLPDAVVIERVPPGLLVQFVHQVQQCVRTDDLVADVRT